MKRCSECEIGVMIPDGGCEVCSECGYPTCGLRRCCDTTESKDRV